MSEINIGTWNVRTLLQVGKLEKLKQVSKQYKMDISAIQEIRWKGCDIIRDKKQQVDLYYSCADKTEQFGCGVAVRGTELQSSSVHPLQRKTLYHPNKGKVQQLLFLCVHASTDVEKDSDAKDAFYDQLERALDSCPNYDTKLILGNLNGQIGSEKVFEGTILP